MNECNMQRVCDIVLSGLALFILSPLLLATMVVLRCTGEGEIFFGQERIGLHGKTFKLLKFATMLKDSPNIGTRTITVKNDSRVLPFGKFLRTTKINELPQLINVLCGKMSLIGPRPLTRETFDAYPKAYQANIQSVTPGLSGIGSIIFRDEEKFITDTEIAKEIYQAEIAPFKGSVEQWYSKNRNIYTYFVLITLTLIVIITRDTKVVWKVFRDLPQPNKFINDRM